MRSSKRMKKRKKLELFCLVSLLLGWALLLVDEFILDSIPAELFHTGCLVISLIYLMLLLTSKS